MKIDKADKPQHPDVLDLALFLTGTAGGKQFIGGTEVKKLKCRDGGEKSGHHKQEI